MDTDTHDYSGYHWIKVKRYVMDESLSWEGRYRQLDAHHVAETSFLIDTVRALAAKLRDLQARQNSSVPDELRDAGGHC